MAEQTQLFRHGALMAWYEAAKPALFTNRVIMEWLSVYNESQRPDAVKLVLLHGILCLRKSFGLKALSLQELASITERGQHAVTLTEGIPALKEEVAEIQQALGSFVELVGTAETTAGHHMQSSIGALPHAAKLAEACERRQHSLGFPNILQKEYPAWWPNDFVNAPKSPQKKPQPTTQRQPPRLAYSMQTAQPETAPLWSNDLVTTQYLDVPSSGYARTADAKWSAGHAANCTLSGLSTVSPAAEHAQSGANKENKTGDGAKLARLKQHLPVRSKVKQQLEQARVLHQQREEARSQQVKTALGPRQPAALQRCSSSPGRRSLQGRYVTEQPATDIADSLMTNPWTAALVGESIGRSDCYDKGPALTRAGLSTWDTPHRGNSFLAAAVAQAGLDNRCCSERSDAACIPICESPDQQIPRQPQQQTDMRSSQPEALQSNSCESAQPYCSLSSRTAADKSNDNSEADAEIAEADYDVAKPSPRETMSVPDSVSPAYRNQTSAEWHDSGSERSVGTGAQAAASRSETRPSQAGSAAMGPAAADTKPACYNQQGSLQQPLRQQQPQQQVLLSQSKQGCQRKQHYTSWTGDYGHLDSPRFTKHRGTAWQAELPSRRDCPHNEPEMHQANAQPMQDTAGKHNRASKVEESVGGSAATLEDDGRWDFAKILSQDS